MANHLPAVSRRALLRRGAIALFGSAAAAALAACGAPLPTPVVPTQAPAKPTEPPKPAEGKPSDKPTAAAQPAATKPAEKPADKPPAAQPAQVQPGQILLRMHSRTGAEGTKPEAAIKVVEQKNPKIRVQLETFPGGEFTTKILALAAGGQVGDLMWGSPSNYHIQVGSGLWFDVFPLVRSTNYDMKPFFQSAIDYLTAHDGKLWSLPYKAHPGAPVLWYNKEALEKAGVSNPAPKSYDELTELALKVHKGGAGAVEQYGFLPNNSYNHAVACLFRAWGTDEVDPIFKAKKSIIDSPKHLEAFTWLHALHHKHKVSPLPGPGVDIGENTWIAQKAAMFQASSSTKGAEAAIAGKFTPRNVVMPNGPSGKLGTKMVFDNFGMYNKTKYPDEAFEVLGYFCGKEHGIRLGLPEGGGSWTCGARHDVFFSEELMKSTPNHKVFAEIIEKTEPAWYPDNFRLNEYETALTQGYQKIMLDPNPPTAAAMKELQQQLQAVLDRPKP
ncbi:MAG TPA: extracellular solute-binding protein [Chloroflexota bacterium]|nr:extracellular solute-binding protein [Chloroflexota bacterium]